MYKVSRRSSISNVAFIRLLHDVMCRPLIWVISLRFTIAALIQHYCPATSNVSDSCSTVRFQFLISVHSSYAMVCTAAPCTNGTCTCQLYATTAAHLQHCRTSCNMCSIAINFSVSRTWILAQKVISPSTVYSLHKAILEDSSLYG